MNFVSRTSLRRALEGHIGGKEETEKIKIQNEKGSNSNLYCIGDEFRLFPPFIQLPRLDFCLGLSTNQFNPFEYVWCINILFERAET
jgi:hypothetical protein